MYLSLPLLRWHTEPYRNKESCPHKCTSSIDCVRNCCTLLFTERANCYCSHLHTFVHIFYTVCLCTPVNHLTLTRCTVAVARARTWPGLACISLCTLTVRAFMHASVFIDTANGFSAAPKFVCSVTRCGRRFIRQVSRIEAWLMTLSDTTADDLTPGSGGWGRQSWAGRGGGVGSKGGWWGGVKWVMIDPPLGQVTLWPQKLGKFQWEKERSNSKVKMGKENQRYTLLNPKYPSDYYAQRQTDRHTARQTDSWSINHVSQVLLVFASFLFRLPHESRLEGFPNSTEAFELSLPIKSCTSYGALEFNKSSCDHERDWDEIMASEQHLDMYAGRRPCSQITQGFMDEYISEHWTAHGGIRINENRR